MNPKVSPSDKTTPPHPGKKRVFRKPTTGIPCYVKESGIPSYTKENLKVTSANYDLSYLDVVSVTVKDTPVKTKHVHFLSEDTYITGKLADAKPEKSNVNELSPNKRTVSTTAIPQTRSHRGKKQNGSISGNSKNDAQVEEFSATYSADNASTKRNSVTCPDHHAPLTTQRSNSLPTEEIGRGHCFHYTPRNAHSKENSPRLKVRDKRSLPAIPTSPKTSKVNLSQENITNTTTTTTTNYNLPQTVIQKDVGLSINFNKSVLKSPTQNHKRDFKSMMVSNTSPPKQTGHGCLESEIGQGTNGKLDPSRLNGADDSTRILSCKPSNSLSSPTKHRSSKAKSKIGRSHGTVSRDIAFNDNSTTHTNHSQGTATTHANRSEKSQPSSSDEIISKNLNNSNGIAAQHQKSSDGSLTARSNHSDETSVMYSDRSEGIIIAQHNRLQGTITAFSNNPERTITKHVNRVEGAMMPNQNLSRGILMANQNRSEGTKMTNQNCSGTTSETYPSWIDEITATHLGSSEETPTAYSNRSQTVNVSTNEYDSTESRPQPNQRLRFAKLETKDSASPGTQKKPHTSSPRHLDHTTDGYHCRYIPNFKTTSSLSSLKYLNKDILPADIHRLLFQSPSSLTKRSGKLKEEQQRSYLLSPSSSLSVSPSLSSSSSHSKPRKSPSSLSSERAIGSSLDSITTKDMTPKDSPVCHSLSRSWAGQDSDASLSDLEDFSSLILDKNSLFASPLLVKSNSGYQSKKASKQTIAASYQLDYCWFCGRPMPPFGLSLTNNQEQVDKMAELERRLAAAESEKIKWAEEQTRAKQSELLAVQKSQALEKELKEIRLKEGPAAECNELDLRAYIERLGHDLGMCQHVLVTRYCCRGFLQKMGSHFNIWKKRWFVFDRTKKMVSYYTDKLERKPRGTLCFQTIQEVYLDHPRTVKSPDPKLTFCVKTYHRTYYLMAPSAVAMTIWIDVLLSGAEGYKGCYES